MDLSALLDFLDVVALGVCVAMPLLVLAQDPRQRANQIFALYLGSLALLLTGLAFVLRVAALAFVLACYGAAAALLVRYRGSSTAGLLRGGALLAVGLAADLTAIPQLFPVFAVAAPLSSILFVQAFLEERLVKPLVVLNRGQEATNRQLLQATEELRASEASISALLENTQDAIWSVDTRSHVVSLNSAARKLFKRAFT